MTKQHARLIAGISQRHALRLVTVAVVAALAPSAMAAPPKMRIVHSFNGSDGRNPGAEPPLVRGPLGTLFGVTQLGGATDEGALFFLDSHDRFHFVNSFSAGTGSGWLATSVFFSAHGQLYGTTAFGGAYECGTAFRVGLIGNVTTIHSFDCVDGYQPNGRVERETVRSMDQPGLEETQGRATSIASRLRAKLPCCTKSQRFFPTKRECIGVSRPDSATS